MGGRKWNCLREQGEGIRSNEGQIRCMTLTLSMLLVVACDMRRPQLPSLMLRVSVRGSDITQGQSLLLVLERSVLRLRGAGVGGRRLQGNVHQSVAGQGYSSNAMDLDQVEEHSCSEEHSSDTTDGDAEDGDPGQDLLYQHAHDNRRVDEQQSEGESAIEGEDGTHLLQVFGAERPLEEVECSDDDSGRVDEDGMPLNTRFLVRQNRATFRASNASFTSDNVSVQNTTEVFGLDSLAPIRGCRHYSSKCLHFNTIMRNDVESIFILHTD